MTQPNRETRRHPAVKPEAPAPEPDNVTPIRIFGGGGDEIMLGGGDTYHCARLTAAGVSKVQQYMTNGIPAVDGDTLGEQIVGGVLATSNFPALQGLLDLIVDEPLPKDIAMVSEPDELITCIDVFFKQSGLRWLEKMVKNLTSRAAATMEQKMGEIMDEAIRTGKTPVLPSLVGTVPVPAS